MASILLIETSTSVLSVALARDGAVVHERICREPRMQASLTAPLVKEVLDEAGLKMADCDAVCVSSGPGSYTGLRVGVSTAKGLCFGASKPLIAV
jgi:tRNA threonylcarbamoyladenosine biosynthesis protein TsaB